MRGMLPLALAVGLALAGCGGSPAGAPGAVEFVETGVDPQAWARVPAGEFLFGQHEHVRRIEAPFEIMVTTVTNAQYADYLNEALAAGWVRLDGRQVVGYYPGDEYHGHKHEQEIPEGDWLHVDLDEPGLRLLFDGPAFSARPGYENHPMVQVTWFGARAYCAFSGGRLPTELEWERAARGDDNRPYPWGERIERANANFYSSRDLIEKILGGYGDTTPVGFYNGRTYAGYATIDSPSPYGLYDMAGNVWQWTGDVYENQHYRYMRGGSRADYGYNLRVWMRNSAGPDYFSPSVGFRCVRPVGP